MADSHLSEDEKLALSLLAGWSNPSAKGRNKKRVRAKGEKTYPWEYQTHGFLEADSKEEQEAREALARLLRSGNPLHQQLLNMLADQFEGVERPFPDYPGSFSQPSARRIVFKEQKKGRIDFARRTEIATHVWRQFRKYGQVEAAVASAMEHYNVSRRHVIGIWGKYRPMFERDPSLAGDP